MPRARSSPRRATATRSPTPSPSTSRVRSVSTAHPFLWSATRSSTPRRTGASRSRSWPGPRSSSAPRCSCSRTRRRLVHAPGAGLRSPRRSTRMSSGRATSGGFVKRPPAGSRPDVTSRIYALIGVALVSAVLLMLTVSTGATFTARTTNPSNQVGTATLAAPTGVSANVQSNGGTARVAWTATTSAWASGHRVYRATNAGGPYTLIQQIAGTATVTYDDVPGVGTFYYVVRGYYNANGANWDSVNSSQASAKPLDHFTFSAIATQHSGSSFNATVIARAQDGAAVSTFNGTVTFSVSSGTIAPTSAAMTNGSLTQSVTLTGAYTTTQ